MNQLDVYRKRPRQWASSTPVILTKRVNERGAKQLEYCSRLCEKEFEWSSSNVKCATLDVMSRKIMVLDAFATRCVAGAASKGTSEPQPYEEAVCQDLLGELSYSLYEIREEVRNREKVSTSVNQPQTRVISIGVSSRA